MAVALTVSSAARRAASRQGGVVGQTSQNLHGTPEPGCGFREGFINAWRRGPCGRPAQGGGARGGPVCVPCGRPA